MIKKMKPIVISRENFEKNISSQLNVQDVSSGSARSTDPNKYPVFGAQVNKKVLIYVPNHTVTVDGVEQLRMDKPLIHTVMDGKRYMYLRCVSNLTDEEIGLDGSCPLCDGVSEPWELARLLINEKCKAAGLDPEDTENVTVKAIRAQAFEARVIDSPKRYYTFPIVVIETVNDDGKTLAYDANNNIKYRVFWYHVSETTYQDKWEQAFEGMEDEPTHPGGHFFMLNFVYATKNNAEPNKRDAARNMSVVPRNMKGDGWKQVAKQFDELTKDWDTYLSQSTVISNQLHSVEDLQEVADEVLTSTRQKIELLRFKNGGEETPALGTNPFNLEKRPVPPTDGEGAAAPVGMDDTDMDMSM